MPDIDPVFFAIPVFMIAIGSEAFVLHRERFAAAVGYRLADTFASLSMGIGFLAINAVFKLALIPAYYLVYEYRLFDIPEVWWAWLLLVILQDFCFYWAHRSHHHVRFLWAAHVNHHSSEHYNLSTALRQSWTEHITAAPFYAPLVLLGFDPITLLLVELFNLFYQFGVHTEAVRSLGPLEKVFNTPSHHRVHHGSNPQYIDKNHAGMFIIWDRIFGTFVPEKEPVRYGLTQNIQTFNPVRIAFHEWASMLRDAHKARSLREAFGYIFAPPGWQPSHPRNQHDASQAEGTLPEGSTP
jgi:sterol desaturase/sphingolipid hydroxylase (fatty acid hydroxylase superfamily)